MNVILFGPQGSGKGTQAVMLKEKLKLYHFSMGDALREEIKNKTAIGKKVAAIMAKGELVPTEITSQLVLLKSKCKEAKNGIIFDGYPRSPEQWAFAKKNLKLDAAIELGLTKAESVKRIASRRVCPKCGQNYNIYWKKPKVEGICDLDKTKLIQRNDDQPVEIKKRLEIYSSQTEPLKKEYKKLGILHVIDGKQPIDKVHAEILKILSKVKK